MNVDFSTYFLSPNWSIFLTKLINQRCLEVRFKRLFSWSASRLQHVAAFAVHLVTGGTLRFKSSVF